MRYLLGGKAEHEKQELLQECLEKSDKKNGVKEIS